jgi:hypothetical protein
MLTLVPVMMNCAERLVEMFGTRAELSALGSVLNDPGSPVHVGEAEAAAPVACAQRHARAAERKKRAA